MFPKPVMEYKPNGYIISEMTCIHKQASVEAVKKIIIRVTSRNK